MADSQQSNFLGGARPKTSIGNVGIERSKDKKMTDKKVDKLKKAEKSKNTLPPETCQPTVEDNCNILLNDSKFKHLWQTPENQCKKVKSCWCGNESEFSTNSMNLFRTKQCYRIPIYNNTCLEDNNSVTGSLHNLTLDSNPDFTLDSSPETNTSQTNLDSSELSNTLPSYNSQYSCTNNTSSPQAFVKWKSAGLALRELLNKKSNKNASLKLSHKDHLKSDHTRCWLQRLHDFDEYDEEFFTCCNLDDDDEVTLTKTGSSSSLLSLESEILSNFSTESKINQADLCSNCYQHENNGTNCGEILEHVNNDNSATDNVLHSLSSYSSSSHNSSILSESICNSTIWNMLQEPYKMSVKDEAKELVSTSLPYSYCDINLCNKVQSKHGEPENSQTLTEHDMQNPLLLTPKYNPEVSEGSFVPLNLDTEISNNLLTSNSKTSVDKNVSKSPINSVLSNVFEEQTLKNSSVSPLSSQENPETNRLDNDRNIDCRLCNCKHFVSSLAQPLLSSLTSSEISNSSIHNDKNVSQNCEFCLKMNTNVPPKKCAFCKIYHQTDSMIDMSTSSLLSESQINNTGIESRSMLTECLHKNKLLVYESESEVTDCSSVCAETSGDVYFSEGTDSSDLPSKLIRLNPTKNNIEYCAQSTNREKKKKVLHTRKSHRRSGSTSSDIEDEKTDQITEETFEEPKTDGNFLLSEILHPSTPLARFLKSHIPKDEDGLSMPWENIEDGLSVESCADGDSNHSLTGMSEGSSLHSNNLGLNLSKSTEPTSQISQHIKESSNNKSMQTRPSTTLRKLLNMEINTELNGENSQYSPETWVRLVDQISLPFDCTEDDNNELQNDNPLVDSTEKSNDFTDLCLPNYDSSASCDADDEFECDCEHCQLLKSVGNTENILPTTTDIDNTSPNSPNNYNWPDLLDDDTSLDLDLSELRPLEPLLNNLQSIPQDLIDLMFQNVIMQMLAVHPELMGDQAPPPVPQSIIDSLPIVITTQLHIEQEVSCPICLCPCQLEETLTILCCQHLFHPLCIQAWLAKSGTCPVCRCTINNHM